MQQYYCSACENKFYDYSEAIFNCPFCGSNNVQNKTKPEPRVLWKTPGFLISAAIPVVMIIILFLLPSAGKHYDVVVVQKPGQCMFLVALLKGGDTIKDAGCQYSFDDGKSWQKSPEKVSEAAGVFTVSVRDTADPAMGLRYQFENPVKFIPACKKPENPCDCGKLSVVKVYQQEQKVIVRASLPKCDIEYSIEGPSGPFQKDSIFRIEPPAKKYNVYVKSAACPAVAYTGTFESRFGGGGGGDSRCPGEYLNESDLQNKPYPIDVGDDRGKLKTILQGLFDGSGQHGNYTLILKIESFGSICGDVQVSPSGNQQVKQTLNDYFSRLGNWSPGYDKQGNSVSTKVVIGISF
jgi:hypothetical protein